MADTSKSVDEYALTAPSLEISERKRLRTRTGCWNCRRKRKKCDERRPTCKNCYNKAETCTWGIKLSFRTENVQTIPENHPSMRQSTAIDHGGKFKLYDVTHEVIRDYWNELHATDKANDSFQPDDSISPAARDVSSLSATRSISSTSVTEPATQDMTLSDTTDHDFHFDREENEMLPLHPLPIAESPESSMSLQSYDMTKSIAAQLLSLGQGNRSVPAGAVNVPPQPHMMSLMDCLPPSAGASPNDYSGDGIFIPGSSYLELHSTLRRNIFDTTRSAATTRRATPEPNIQIPGEISPVQDSLVSSPSLAELSPEEEYTLWKNWTDEVATWLDKFDIDCHFGRKLPLLAQHHNHLRFSILAVSARQLERKHQRPSSGSMALYQEAIHQLVPHLQTRSTAVVASCVVLCVLEMMSCEPRMWRRHLDGCASLIQSLGINGFSGGMDQALFWCFARMDVCGGLISSERTLIPMSRWTSGLTLAESVHLFRSVASFDAYASYAVYLCGQVLDLFACSLSHVDFLERWNELFALIEDWYTHRPPDFQAILNLTPSDTDYQRPFPIMLFSNPPAISGTQMYHTAALLMLQRKPIGAKVADRSRSVLWHARRICAISISNTHHGCWTNCVQPLWIAGQLMSHPAEHRAILETYKLIETETGWGTEWRANDLKAHWGSL